MTTLEVISLAGLLSGVLDIAATSTLLKSRGIPIEQLLQTIASGVFGPSAFQKGKGTATLGLLLHFFIAFAAASIYYAISRKMTILLDHPLLWGSMYGITVHLVTSRIVVPLSAAPKRDFSARAFLTQLIIHICFVGLPIAFIVSHFSR
jgi:hypothetical protein